MKQGDKFIHIDSGMECEALRPCDGGWIVKLSNGVEEPAHRSRLRAIEAEVVDEYKPMPQKRERKPRGR